MTRSERMKAFEMRLCGANWSEIGRELGYASTTVRADLLSCVNAPPRQVNCVYPAIRDIITSQYGGSVRSLARDCKIPENTLYSALSGRVRMNNRTRTALLRRIELPPEEAFRRKDEP